MNESITRRDVLKGLGVTAGTLAAFGAGGAFAQQTQGGVQIPPPGMPGLDAAGQAEKEAEQTMEPMRGMMAEGLQDIGMHTYKLPPLPYAYNALEPHIDEETLRLHHDKHHAGYVNGLNAALKKLSEAAASGDPAMAKYWARDAAFNGSGHLLHAHYWENMKPGGGGQPTGSLAKMIDMSFGGFSGFASSFKAIGGGVPGSGWGVLVFEPMGKRLVIVDVEKHENVQIIGAAPLLVMDVWEHAYYLRYQNRRGDYIDAFLSHLVNWDAVQQRLDAVMSM